MGKRCKSKQRRRKMMIKLHHKRQWKLKKRLQKKAAANVVSTPATPTVEPVVSQPEPTTTV